MADNPEPEKLLAYKIPEVLREYLYRTRELGALEGDLGAMDIHPEFKKLVAAMHHVIAGGKIEIAVVEPGNQDVASELDARWDESVGALGR